MQSPSKPPSSLPSHSPTIQPNISHPLTSSSSDDPKHDPELASNLTSSEPDLIIDEEKSITHSHPNSQEEEDQEKGNNHNHNAINKTSTHGTTASWRAVEPPPDGGARAWLQVLLSHLVIMNTWGFINSFGIFQTYYSVTLLPSSSSSSISWIGSIEIFLLFFVGTFSGRVTDAGYFIPVFLFGSFLSLLGLFMTSISTTYWQIFLAQGVCMGLGNGMLFCPTLTLLSTYFSRKRNLAIGLAAAGSATGGVVFPAMVQQLLPKVGFGWTMRALGFITMACLLVCSIGLKPRVPPRRTGPLVDWESFRDWSYLLYAAGMFFNFWGLYFGFYYLGSFGTSIVGLPYSESVDLIMILNGVGSVGRVLPNHLADRFFGPLNTLIPITFFNCIIIFSWIAVSSRGGLYAWSVIYGTFAAGIQSLFPATLSSLTTDLRKAGVRMGMVFTIVSFAVLTGPPIGGVLIQKKHGDYEYAQIFAAVDLFIGMCLLLLARLAKSKKLRVKM